MSLADKLTASRICLAPVFFVVCMWGLSWGLSASIYCALMWTLFALMELSDMFDGMAARRTKTVSSFGKLFDPFADVFARLTYFVCFSFMGVMPVFVFLIILYREFSQLFLRQLMAIRGVAMAARMSGKAKAVSYTIAAAASLVLVTLGSFGIEDLYAAHTIAAALNYTAGLFAVVSFLDYIVQYKKAAAHAAD